MKACSLLIFSFFLILISCSTQQEKQVEQSDQETTEAEFIYLSESEVNDESLTIASKLSEGILAAQKAGGSYELSATEAETRMVNAFSDSTQKQMYEQILGAFGEYEGMTFYQMAKPTNGTLYEIYRFRGDFDSDSPVEIRTVLNGQRKLAGFFVIPWKDDI